MTVREQKMAFGVGAGTVFLLAVVLGYLLVVMPLGDRARSARALEDDIAEKDAKLRAFLKDRPRLEIAKKRSLPTNTDIARQEYDAALNRVLREAKVPLTSSTVTPKVADGKATPELAPKKPAYSRIVFEIKLKPIDIGTLVNVLVGYYKLDLLQQITTFKVKRNEIAAVGTGAGNQRRGPIFDRADLEVTLVTEAIILDGAENRKSLVAVPLLTAVTGGGAGYAALTQTAGVTRGLAPQQIVRVLADPNRDYAVLVQKDPIHGPPVVLSTYTAPKEEKEDTSSFIRLTGAGRNSDGSGSAFIADIASHQEYEIEINIKPDGKLDPRVIKYYFTSKSARKKLEEGPDLDISEATSRTARKFRVVGIDDNGLVLAERLDGEKGASSPGPGGGKGGGKGGGRGRGGEFPIAAPTTAVTGAAPAAVPPEKIFLWKHGETLNKVAALTPSEATKLLHKIVGPAAATIPLREEAPMPTGVTAGGERVVREEGREDASTGGVLEDEENE
ncbi:hypothetical protein [Fimbriiglobus ruber]|uniref:Uncharacterized protein n=1 Tax=Fimbriiglobus ruber TaxID=1908690 RepID=A0A225DVV3_9BACT|nr:hypothetical protein [Fimbriiglobus ruber]OWK45670.1 hypothetical protein FRUB_02001 [Fimbriiglobus ruber]